MLCLSCDESNNNNLNGLRYCGHKFCNKCLHDHIKKHFDCKIKCPYYNRCNKYISDRDIRRFISNSDENRYDLLCMGKLYFKCLSKNCTFIFSTIENDINFECPECLQPNCVKCKKRHLPSDCGSNNQKSEEERDSAAKLVLQNKRLNQLHSYDETHDLISAHDGFECPICCEFILPKNGVMLRCGCSHCKECLIEAYKELKYINQLFCHECSTEFDEIEKKAIMGSENLRSLSAGVMRKLLWHCKNPDCDKTWHTDKKTGFIICSDCNKTNCLSCDSVHGGKTCEQFRQTKEYTQLKASKNTATNMAKVRCFKCKELLIQGGGCNALPCPACNVYTCLFKGIKAGVGGCGCTSMKPCDPKCRYGCNPE